MINPRYTITLLVERVDINVFLRTPERTAHAGAWLDVLHDVQAAERRSQIRQCGSPPDVLVSLTGSYGLGCGYARFPGGRASILSAADHGVHDSVAKWPDGTVASANQAEERNEERSKRSKPYEYLLRKSR